MTDCRVEDWQACCLRGHCRAAASVPSVVVSKHAGLQVDAVVFLVDALDRERFVEAKKELDSLLSDDGLAKVPFLVLGNKIDVPQVASA